MSPRPPFSVRLGAAGMTTSVGLSAPSSVAAIRAGVSNASTTRFVDWGGEPIVAHVVPLDAPDLPSKLLRMATSAIDECLATLSAGTRTALLLCVAEPARQGSSEALVDRGIDRIAAALGTRFAPDSTTIAAGRVGGLIALQRAKVLLAAGQVDAVIVAGVDSLVEWKTLSGLEDRHRLLTSRNSNGFIAGEAAAAVVVTPGDATPSLHCDGIGFADEAATVDADLPLRADGLVAAVRAAAAEACCSPGDFALRLSALSGEHYFFKEAALAASRLIRVPADDSELWHSADCVGEVGAAASALALALAAAASAGGHAQASRMLVHVSGDGRERAAAFLRQGAPR